jgi:ribose transport system ATP-binding protein
MYDGRVVTELVGSTITEEALISAALNITTPTTSAPAGEAQPA